MAAFYADQRRVPPEIRHWRKISRDVVSIKYYDPSSRRKPGPIRQEEPMEKVPCVYILASKRHGTLYIGVTGDLCSRVRDHKLGAVEGFTKRYGVKLLVWFEFFGSMDEAIKREKQLKEWQRDWKIELIEKMNPTWTDLYDDQCGKFIP